MPAPSKPIRETSRFPNTGADFSGLDAATAWLDEQGYSYGPIQRSEPIAVLRGDVWIAKWRSLDDTELAALDGVIECEGDFRNGAAVVKIFDGDAK